MKMTKQQIKNKKYVSVAMVKRIRRDTRREIIDLVKGLQIDNFISARGLILLLEKLNRQ